MCMLFFYQLNKYTTDYRLFFCPSLRAVKVPEKIVLYHFPNVGKMVVFFRTHIFFCVQS